MNPCASAIPFVKASACGNDFLLIHFQPIKGENIAHDLAALTRRICDRHEGVGADGVEWMYPHPTADVEIRLINADGSEAEISGNGTRCVAAHVYAAHPKESITIQTGAGLKTCTFISSAGSDYEFEIEMGNATVAGELDLGDGVRGIPISMGNPHCVVFVKEFADGWREQAKKIQNNPRFQNGVNVEMVIVDGKHDNGTHDVRARFFERGVGETQSSGTGSCASAVAAISQGRAKSPVRVHAPGGTQVVRTVGEAVWLRGPARLVCRGEFLLH